MSSDKKFTIDEYESLMIKVHNKLMDYLDDYDIAKIFEEAEAEIEYERKLQNEMDSFWKNLEKATKGKTNRKRKKNNVASLYFRFDRSVNQKMRMEKTEKLVQFAKDKGFTIQNVYIDFAPSRKIKDRDAFVKLMHEIINGEIDYFICERIENVFRDMPHMMKFRQHLLKFNVDIITMENEGLNDLQFNILSSIMEWEHQQLSEQRKLQNEYRKKFKSQNDELPERK